MAVVDTSTTFSIAHIALLCRYIGIGIIASAVSQGSLQSTRTLMTACIGVLLFALGHIIEFLASDRPLKGSLFKALILGLLLAIGIGLLLGGLQQFPTLPQWGVWLVPLGFLISLIALVLSIDRDMWGHWKTYALTALALVGAGSFAAYNYFNNYSLVPKLANSSVVAPTVVEPPVVTANLDPNSVVNAPSPAATTSESSPTTPEATTHSTGSMAIVRALPPKSQPSIDEIEAAFEAKEAQEMAANGVEESVLTPDEVVERATERDNREAALSEELNGQATSTPSRPNTQSAVLMNPATEVMSTPIDIGQKGDANTISREVDIIITDNLKYDPNHIIVRQNETIKFNIVNNSLVKQDWSLGDANELRQLATQKVLDPETLINPLLMLEPGEKGEVIWRFTRAGSVDFASLQAGYYGAGLVGRVIVMP